MEPIATLHPTHVLVPYKWKCFVLFSVMQGIVWPALFPNKNKNVYADKGRDEGSFYGCHFSCTKVSPYLEHWFSLSGWHSSLSIDWVLLSSMGQAWEHRFPRQNCSQKSMLVYSGILASPKAKVGWIPTGPYGKSTIILIKGHIFHLFALRLLTMCFYIVFSV
jgi:hypothetical protein